MILCKCAMLYNSHSTKGMRTSKLCHQLGVRVRAFLSSSFEVEIFPLNQVKERKWQVEHTRQCDEHSFFHRPHSPASIVSLSRNGHYMEIFKMRKKLLKCSFSKFQRQKKYVKVLDLLDPGCLNVWIPAGNYGEMKTREGRKRKEASRAHIAPGREDVQHSTASLTNEEIISFSLWSRMEDPRIRKQPCTYCEKVERPDNLVYELVTSDCALPAPPLTLTRLGEELNSQKSCSYFRLKLLTISCLSTSNTSGSSNLSSTTYKI